jgi:hypothetical protein
MRRALAWTAGIVGIAAFARLLRRRSATPRVEVQPAADPAHELRRVLNESRASEGASQPQLTEAADEPSVDERRADVHARAESAIARMRQGDG